MRELRDKGKIKSIGAGRGAKWVKKMNIYQLKEIETPRLIIRPVRLGDKKEINQAINRSLDTLQRWMPWAKDPSLVTTLEFCKQADIGWKTQNMVEFPMVAIHKETKKIISASGFNERSDLTKPYYEIGYWIDKDYQGQGLVTELVNALTRYALIALKAVRVQISTQVENTKSIAVAKRCGYVTEAILRAYTIDCESLKPADSLMLACTDVTALPDLAVTWRHNKKTEAITIHNEDSKAQCESKVGDKLPMLETARLKLIPPNMHDIDLFYEAQASSIKEVGPWFTWAKSTATKEDIGYHIREAMQASQDIRSNDHLFYLVWDKDQKNLLGEVWYKVLEWEQPLLQINYWFDTRHTGKGYATEAVARLVEYGLYELKARRIQLHAAETNSKSQKLAQSLGFVLEGQLKNHAKNFITGEILDSKMYSMVDIKELKKSHT